jgi:hypothetical protein
MSTFFMILYLRCMQMTYMTASVCPVTSGPTAPAALTHSPVGVSGTTGEGFPWLNTKYNGVGRRIGKGDTRTEVRKRSVTSRLWPGVLTPGPVDDISRGYLGLSTLDSSTAATERRSRIRTPGQSRLVTDLLRTSVLVLLFPILLPAPLYETCCIVLNHFVLHPLSTSQCCSRWSRECELSEGQCDLSLLTFSLSITAVICR